MAEASETFDWQGRYEDGNTPWDLGGPHPELSRLLSSGALAPARRGDRALVPGAGRGHDALALARRGWAVTAVELVPGIGAAVAPELARRGGALLEGDVFALDLEGPFALVWDHTFFCAIDPDVRSAWGQRAAEVLAPDGAYVALLFPHGKPAESGGPPFGVDAAAVGAALGPRFRLEGDRPLERPVARRTWPERLARFERA